MTAPRPERRICATRDRQSYCQDVTKRRRVLTIVCSVAALVIGLVALHDLVLYRKLSFLPNEYCRVSEVSAAERGLQSGDLTTTEADSGCREGEVHLCGYQRFVLAEVIEVRRQPC